MLDWKRYGPIFALAERVFRGLQFLTGALRPGKGVRHSSQLHAEKLWRNDIYHIVVFAVEGLAVYLVASHHPALNSRHPALNWIILAFASLRVLDIMQAGVNTVLFDYIRQRERGIQTILSLHRKLLLEALNYLELIVLFGLLYATIPSGSILKAGNWTDLFYFSAITQLTVGYGELTPGGLYKAVAVLQSLLGFFFSLLVLARVLSALPPMHDLAHEGPIEQSDPIPSGSSPPAPERDA